MQLCAHTYDLRIFLVRKVQCLPEDPPLGSESTKCHFNTNSHLREEEVVCPVGFDVEVCTTEWNEYPSRQGVCIVANDEVFRRQ